MNAPHQNSGIDYSALGFRRVAAICPPVAIGDPRTNAERTWAEAKTGDARGASIVVFPELGLTSYTAEDLFGSESLLQETRLALRWLTERTAELGATLLVGAPYRAFDGRLYNAAFVLSRGKIRGAVPKTHLPNYGEFYEKRWFVPGGDVALDVRDELLGEFHLGTRQLFKLGEAVLGVEICEDLWAPIPPSSYHALAGANLIANLSASNELVAKAAYRRELIRQHSARLNAGYVYTSSGPTESSKDLVFGGHTMIAENGVTLAEGRLFELEGERLYADVDLQKLLHERARNGTFANQAARVPYRLVELEAGQPLAALERKFSKTPALPSDPAERGFRFQEILSIQATGLARRLLAARAETMVIGVSGGLDSTWALLVMIEAAKTLRWEPARIVGVTLPGMGTSAGTKRAALDLMRSLGVTSLEIPIGESVRQHFKDIGHDPERLDVVYENSQARERTQILFDLANQRKGIVVGTGDLSELCLGWCTYNGDHMSNYGVNASVFKTLMQGLVEWYAAAVATSDAVSQTLRTVLATEISPELLPPAADGSIRQTTEGLIGPYRLHDFFIHHHLRSGFGAEKIYRLATLAFADEYGPEAIRKWLRVFFQRFYTQQFKRTTLPSGPKIGSISISPRGDLRLPDETEIQRILDRIEAL